MSGFSFQIVTELRGFPELFLVEQAFRANAEKGPGQLVVVSVAARQPVIVDEYLQLAFP